MINTRFKNKIVEMIFSALISTSCDEPVVLVFSVWAAPSIGVFITVFVDNYVSFFHVEIQFFSLHSKILIKFLHTPSSILSVKIKFSIIKVKS